MCVYTSHSIAMARSSVSTSAMLQVPPDDQLRLATRRGRSGVEDSKLSHSAAQRDGVRATQLIWIPSGNKTWQWQIPYI